MRLFFSLFIVVSCMAGVYGQKFSAQVRTLTTDYFSSLSEEHKPSFKALIRQRSRQNWLKRIDNHTYDYAFIEERICFEGRKRVVTERYFSADDSIPQTMYINGRSADIKEIYNGFLIWYSKNVTYYTTLHPLIKKYSALAPVCELPYDSMQVWSHGCVTCAGHRALFTAQRTRELKNTWQIQTLIDRRSGRVVVSLQYAPEAPHFVTFGYNSAWDW